MDTQQINWKPDNEGLHWSLPMFWEEYIFSFFAFIYSLPPVLCSHGKRTLKSFKFVITLSFRHYLAASRSLVPI